MPKHIKPTVEELDEKINENLKIIDEEGKKSEEQGVEVVEKSKKKLQETPEVEEAPKEEPKETPKEPEKKEDTFKKRYEDSTREAQVLYAKSKKMSEAILKASEIAEPTEEELGKEFPEWEEMSDFERRMAKDSFVNKKKLEAISEIAHDFKDMDAWNIKIDKFLADPETLANHPELEGDEAEFKIFASRDTRRGVDFEDLVSAYLYTVDSRPKVVHKGKMFETGSGGINEKPKPSSNKLSFDEGQQLKITNYKMYIRMLREDKIETPEV